MSKNFKLYTVGTPNGHKVSVFLQELKAVYPDIDWEYVQRFFYTIVLTIA